MIAVTTHCRWQARWLVKHGPADTDVLLMCDGHKDATMKEGLRHVGAVVTDPRSSVPEIEAAILYPKIIDIAPEDCECEVVA